MTGSLRIRWWLLATQAATSFGCSHDQDVREIEATRARALQPRDCAITAVAPAFGSTFFDVDDRDPAMPGLQLGFSLGLSGADCTAVSWGTCAPDGSYRTPLQIFRMPLSQADAGARTQDLSITLEQPGRFGLCAQIDDGARGLTAYTTVEFDRCAASEVFCAAARSCVADSATNPEQCGPTCAVCPSGQDTIPVCAREVCTQQCKAPDYHLDATGCLRRPGCTGLAQACQGGDCCAADVISSNGKPVVYQRGYDASDVRPEGLPEWQAKDDSKRVTLDAFVLDRFEVTVSRFRAFVAAYDDFIAGKSNPKVGAGSHPNPALTGTGWQTAWLDAQVDDQILGRSVAVVPTSAAELVQRVTACDAVSYTQAAGPNEIRAMNCVSFYEAYLFCIWDGAARLPTEAEWNAAAAGADLQRAFPWSDPPGDQSIVDQAVTAQPDNSLPFEVGHFLKGAGRWGTLDLAGNVWEWVRDTGNPPPDWSYVETTLINPIQLDNDDTPSARHRMRGGSFKKVNEPQFPAELSLRTAARELRAAPTRLNDVGFRCARNVAP